MFAVKLLLVLGSISVLFLRVIGLPGVDGKDGVDGRNGSDGSPGPPGTVPDAVIEQLKEEIL